MPTNGIYSRRTFLGATTLSATAAMTGWPISGCQRTDPASTGWQWNHDSSWTDLRRYFQLNPDYIHMAGMLITSHPQPVRDAISEYRDALDDNPVQFLESENNDLEGEVRAEAAQYLGVQHNDLALTDSTTMGIALVYNGISIRPDQEILTTTNDYYSTLESLKYKAERSGATVRTVELFEDSARASADEMTSRIIAAIQPNTRVLALTWVHSWTGIKIPVRRIADELERINENRETEDRVLFCLDGVHGLGVESEDLPELGCDFFMAGTHKWMFAPRGTGVLWGNPRAQDAVTPTIPTFSNSGGWGGRMTPGGFKAFEHVWAMAQAFRIHRDIGKTKVTERIRALNTQCKEELARMRHVRLYTPHNPAISAGIICFDINGMSPHAVVRALASRKVISSVTPYREPHARLSPGLLNNPSEVDATMAAIRALA